MINRETIQNPLKDRRRVFLFALSLFLILASITSYFFVSHDEGLYRKTIAKITSVSESAGDPYQDFYGHDEKVTKQSIQAMIMNGPHKGDQIHLDNTYSYSQAVDCAYKTGDEVFVSLNHDKEKNADVYDISGFKRDKYIAFIGILFALFMLLIGGWKGLRSLASVVVNILIFFCVIELYLGGFNLILTATAASLLFVVVSIAIVSGVNKKSAAAILGTAIGTLLAMVIALIVIGITHGNGIHYEEMEFLTRPPEQIFLMEILIGTLGGIMDIAISISSAIQELYETNPLIDRKTLIRSGKEIGKDIMGTMANTLVFAYISGSIPMILLWLKNGYPMNYIVSINICLEVIRALTGSIGIVLSIPVTLYIAVFLLKNHKKGEVLES